jgi:hypothetical protein
MDITFEKILDQSLVMPLPVVITDGGREAAGFTRKAKRGDCITRAVAIAAELDYKKVWDDFTAMNENMQLCKGRC